MDSTSCILELGLWLCQRRNFIKKSPKTKKMMSSFLKFIYCLVATIYFFPITSVRAALPPSLKMTAEPPPNTIFETLQSEAVFDLTINLPLDSLITNKSAETYHPSGLSYKNKNGDLVNRAVKVKVRGKSRRRFCDFPPLKIKFSKKELTAQGLDKSHRSLKLVTHCNDDTGSKQNVLEEYLAYKMYNILTTNSLKVQLVKIKYEDTNSKKNYKRYGFLIEDIDEMAERQGRKEIEGFNIPLKDFDKEQLQIMAVFQYMIGNEDWRLPFMRNIKFIQSNEGGKIVAVPYDFDFSGLVAANYAKPDQDLQLKSVRQRAFQGAFDSKKERDQIVKFFNTKKGALYKLIREFKTLDKISRVEVETYLDAFFKIINEPNLLNKAMPLNGDRPIPTKITGKYTLK